MPLAGRADTTVGELAALAFQLRPEQRDQLRRLVASLPQERRTGPAPEPPEYERYAPSFGALIARMLRNRNLGWTDSAKLLFHLAHAGPLSASTVGLVGHGRKEPSPELLATFAAVLAVPVEDLAALGGVALPCAVQDVGQLAIVLGPVRVRASRTGSPRSRQHGGTPPTR